MALIPYDGFGSVGLPARTPEKTREHIVVGWTGDWDAAAGAAGARRFLR